MKKILLTLFVGIFLISLVSSIETLGTFKQNECIQLRQTCASCSYVNFTKVSYPNSSIALSNVQADRDGTSFNYTFCDTKTLGTYIVEGVGDVDGIATVFAYDFEITPSGQSGTENIVFFIVIILIVYGLTFFGFFGKNIPITILGGMAMIFLGVYLISQGVIIYRDTLTNYIAYLTIGVGIITSFWAILEQLDVF